MKKIAMVTSLLVIFSLLLIAGQGEAQKVRFGSSVFDPTYHLPFIAAKEKGIWKEMDVDVEWIPFRSGPVMIRAVSAGEVDMTMAGTTSTIQAIVAGVPQIMVADVKNVYPSFFFVRADSPLKEPKDLRGTRVGVTGLGGMMHAYARAVTKSLGLEKEVKFVGAGGVKEQAAALKAGAIESTVTSFSAIVPLKFKGEVREFLAVADYLPREWSETPLVARTGFASRFPRELVKAMKGYFKATDFIQANRYWAVENMKTALGYEEDLARFMYPKLMYGREGKINPKVVENIVNFLIEFGIVAKEKVPPIDKIYDNSFADQAWR